MDESTRPAEAPAGSTPVADAVPQGGSPAPPPPSDADAASETSFFDGLIRGGRRLLGMDTASAPADREAEATGDATEAVPTAAPAAPAWTPPASPTELERLVQSEVDRREAKRTRDEGVRRTAAEWERVKQLARDGDTWALGEVAQAGVSQRVQEEEAEARYRAVADTHIPIWDKTFLDPLLAPLGEAVWKPIVGDGLRTLEARQAAVAKAIDAHRAAAAREGAEAAVTKALEDERFVQDLLASPSFRTAWLKSEVVRAQFNARRRGDDDLPAVVPGLAAARVAADENATMDAFLRGLTPQRAARVGVGRGLP